ncbi:hypothetical protein GCM10027036_06980 [Flavihumibacter cheonanensis]|uniref:hypothetical protein n=1 Tax=Flavihumibacter cheonanensis TaxID=1442385 RepID=UPI001EF78305|nr:hypothetical protein [Flavihumibacter cheonanensis]MCG7751856.1 hypothetical protein [Flavihumibacter cheonanensis]
MKNILILSLSILCISISLESSAQQKRRLSRTELQAKQANLPHKKPMLTKAEADAILAKRRMEARENKTKMDRMKAELQQRERSVGNRE